jgi:UDP-N-acetylglucosamine enolpyruvyl transferase
MILAATAPQWLVNEELLCLYSNSLSPYTARATLTIFHGGLKTDLQPLLMCLLRSSNGRELIQEAT